MIQQRVGDLLEIQFDSKYYYVVILTKIVMFGGNVVFAFHSNGTKRNVSDLTEDAPGFNVCVDLLWPKKEGNVQRLNRFTDIARFWRTRYTKTTFYHHKELPREWGIHRMENIAELHDREIACTRSPSPEYAGAMERATFDFGTVACLIDRGHTWSVEPMVLMKRDL